MKKFHEQEGSSGFMGCVAECETASDLLNSGSREPDQIEMITDYGSVVAWGDDAHSIAGQNDIVNGDVFAWNNWSPRIEGHCEVTGCGSSTFSEDFLDNGVLNPSQVCRGN